MKNGMSSEDKATLEALIDRHDLDSVVYELAEICYGKADHVATNWQDRNAAAVWTRAGHALDAVWRKWGKPA